MGKVVFITGGVRSGKSAFAERYAIEHMSSTRNSLVYIASGVAFDQEMEQRIQRHQQDRLSSPYQWKTIEVRDDFHPQLMTFTEMDIVLWDCITTWLNNVLFKTEKLHDEERLSRINTYITELKTYIKRWKENKVIIMIVSNEVLDEPSSNYVEVNLYRKLLGELHQWIVAMCDEAYEMDYRILKRWK
ncbi:bifunctional adenosylcobinamide kinase/adenosylcobinamide-phosphate guanylyltransferase [Lysinibacillus sp. BW-2-10]|uniref:bifunctional adenosylcobinamide kinase/adenosylcobinamide-phosphate guanylyltransferase n=1 Tax=Lysinibacillus sp. BW-2-10 TaxID=2590030 RepID=UPI00117F6FCB|nr:bifunctional adenosylcobinamide kinase/adenosylcobinamide-phosphate guanylyltransferase [Lysinibacillus sp. BW-2-10]TSI03352.1 bifunctional adenosylcobinamide kinase/adenosylcobinamide-phosphate guanylyltransferase [Lysinibacillus sp. BW-2-10]